MPLSNVMQHQNTASHNSRSDLLWTRYMWRISKYFICFTQCLLLQEFVSDARAFWVTSSLIAWDVSDQETSLYLYASGSATMYMSNGVIEGKWTTRLLDSFTNDYINRRLAVWCISQFLLIWQVMILKFSCNRNMEAFQPVYEYDLLCLFIFVFCLKAAP